MHILFIILIAIAIVIALVFILSQFMKNEHYVKSEVVIHVSANRVYEFLRFLKNQEKFNKWAKADMDRHSTTKGVDGDVGFVYAWNGDRSVGEGEKEILNLVENKKIETEIRFVRPMKTKAKVTFEMETLTNDQTKLAFINAGNIKAPWNVLLPLFQKNFAKDMNESMQTLKGILEKE
jgi:uncharacterized protein YndB with AHSA1/START domain